MSVFYQLFFQAVIIGAFFGSFTAIIVVYTARALVRIIKNIIKRIRSKQ